MDIFRAERSQQGLDYYAAHQLVQRQFPSITITDIRKIITDCTNDGLLYSTIDEDHFATTEN